jgi:polyhydroxyalkanoate synthesis regulator phasin
MFDQSKEMLFDICKAWQKSDVIKGVGAYYDNFEELSADRIQRDIDEYKKAITDLNRRASELKKEIKKDKEKQATLEEVKQNLTSRKSELEAKKKELVTLPKQVKSLKAEFDTEMKALLKGLDDLAKLRGQDAKLRDESDGIAQIEFVLLQFVGVNKLVEIDEIIKEAKLEIKVTSDSGEKAVKEFRKMLVLFMESAGTRLLGYGLGESLLSKKVMFFQKAATMLNRSSNIAKMEKFDFAYHDKLFSIAQGCLVIGLGTQLLETFEYSRAAQYFLKAREILKVVSGDHPHASLAAEQAAVARASASDAFNVLYMLNSYVNWKMVSENASGELKSIASISIRNIEEWITKQYGFPPDDKINDILGSMLWPKPLLPDEAKFPARRGFKADISVLFED